MGDRGVWTHAIAVRMVYMIGKSEISKAAGDTFWVVRMLDEFFK